MDHSPTVVICEDTTDLHSKLSDYLQSIITAAIDDIEKSDEFRHVIIGVSGGAMPKLIVPVLLAIDNIDWASKVRFFSVDERMVPLNDSESNTGAYLTELNGGIYHFPPYGPIDCVQTCAANYEAHIRSWHPKIDDGWPMFDLLLLGLGTDGHTCSLFPDHRLLDTNDTNWIVPIDDSPKPPPHRITITLPVINRAANVAFIAFGAAKAEIVKAIVKDGSKKYPAGRVNVANLHWFLDRESAEHL